MAKHTHIHVHIHDSFEESKHKREGGKFSSTGGGGAAAPQPATRGAAFAAKHNPAAARKGAGPQGEKEVSEEKASLL